MKNKILVLVLFFALVSCISEYNPTLSDKDTDILVVEGDIIGNSLCTFYLGKNVSLGSDWGEEDYTAEGVITLIDSNGNESQPATGVGKGEYRLQVGELDANVQYGLKIVYDGNTYQSELSYPLYTPPIDSLSFSQPELYGLVEFTVSTHDTSSDIGYYRWRYEEDWEEIAAFITSISYDMETDEFYEFEEGFNTYYCWRKTRNNKQTVISSSKLKENRIINQPVLSTEPGFRFRILYCITVTQQTLSRRGFEYFYNKQATNDDMGGLFSPQPSMVEGNISCITDPDRGVIGYIEVNENLASQRLFIPSGQISSPSTRYCDSYSPDSLMRYLSLKEVSFYDFYRLGYRPIGDIFIPKGMIEWGTAQCVDCTKNGGTKDRPDWWPDNGHY